MKVIDLVSDYEVASGQVKLTIDIGNAQIGSSIAKVGSSEKGRGVVKNVSLGKGSAIRGKKLKIKSVVTDVNDSTNKTIITYKINGGKRNQQFVSSGTVDADGDSIIYRAMFNLV